MLEQHIFEAKAGIKTMHAFYPRAALIGWETLPPWHSVGESEGKKMWHRNQPTISAFTPRHHNRNRLNAFCACMYALSSYLNILYCVCYGPNNA